MFRHLSSQGGISGVELDDRFYDSSIDLTYRANYNDMSWNLNLGYKTKSITGMDYRKILAHRSVDRSSLIYGIDPQHTYNTISFGGKIDFNESIINEAE
jgi:hypothetical protein